MKPFHYHEDPLYAAATAILKGQTVTEEAAYKILSESNAYLNKLKKLNPGWNPKDAKGDFQNEYDPDDAKDAKDHADYLKSADKFLDDISSFKPGVKIGDWVEIYIQNSPVRSKIGIGKIIAEKTLKGHDYGYMGYKGPSNIPGWQVKAFVEDVNGDYEDKQANDYVMFNGKTYMNIGSVFYIQHDENQKNTFRKLPKQNLKVVELEEDVAVEESMELDESIKTRIADLLLNLSGSDTSDMIKLAADTFKKNALALSHSVAADKKDEYEKAIKDMYAELLDSKTLTDFEKNGKKLAVQMKAFKEDTAVEEEVSIEEGNGSYNMGTATITAPGNKLHGKQVSVFHKFDDGRLNVQFAKSDKKGDVLNLTLNKGQYKLD